MPPKGRSRGPMYTYSIPPTQAGPPGPAWAPAFRAPRDGSEIRGKHQGSAEQTRAPQDRSGPAVGIRVSQYESGSAVQIRAPRGTDQSPEGRIRAPWDRSCICGTDQGSAGRSWALQDEAGPRKTNESGLRRTNQGPAGRIRSPRNRAGPRGTKQGTARQMRALKDEVGSGRTNEGPTRRIRASRNESGLEEQTRAR